MNKIGQLGIYFIQKYEASIKKGLLKCIIVQCAPAQCANPKQSVYFMRRKLSLLKWRSFLPWKCCYAFIHLSSPNLTGNDLHLVFFGYKLSTKQHLKHVCFGKMPRNSEFAHKIHSLTLSLLSPETPNEPRKNCACIISLSSNKLHWWANKIFWLGCSSDSIIPLFLKLVITTQLYWFVSPLLTPIF